MDEYDVVSSSSTDTTLPARKRVHISSDSEVDVSFMSEFLETEYEHFDEYAARQEILASHTRSSARLTPDRASHESEPPSSKKSRSTLSSLMSPLIPARVKKSPVRERSHLSSFFTSRTPTRGEKTGIFSQYCFFLFFCRSHACFPSHAKMWRACSSDHYDLDMSCNNAMLKLL